MATRNSDTPNLVKSLFLDPRALNDHNLKLKAKYERMKREDLRYEAYNADTDYQALIVSFGTMSRVCRTAIDALKRQGIEVGMIRPQTLFPFPEKAIHEAAIRPSCKVVLSIELNMGQMLEDVQRAVLGERPVYWHGNAGGDIPSPEDIMDLVKSFL